MSTQAIADSIKAKMSDGTDIGASVKFDCGDDGVVVIDGGAVSTENKDTDCTIKCDIGVLQDLVAGDQNVVARVVERGKVGRVALAGGDQPVAPAGGDRLAGIDAVEAFGEFHPGVIEHGF